MQAYRRASLPRASIHRRNVACCYQNANARRALPIVASAAAASSASTAATPTAALEGALKQCLLQVTRKHIIHVEWAASCCLTQTPACPCHDGPATNPCCPCPCSPELHCTPLWRLPVSLLIILSPTTVVPLYQCLLRFLASPDHIMRHTTPCLTPPTDPHRLR